MKRYEIVNLVNEFVLKENPTGLYVLHQDVESQLRELEIYRLRLAGALMASEGANPLTFKEKDVLPEIRDCVTINSILDLYAEMQKYKAENEMLSKENEDLRNRSENKQ